MLKKTRFIISVILATIFFVNCNKTSGKKTQNPIPSKSESTEINNNAPSSASTSVLDLTKMSPTMIYSTIFEMLIEPEIYKNRIIKVKGFFNTYYDEATLQTYYFIVIPDATACCKQGIEFKFKSPADKIPQINEEITITGKFTMEYLSGDIIYSFLQLI